jgi:hypothetical protein
MAEYAENKSKGETIKCYCNKCGRDINHTVLMDYYEVIKYGKYIRQRKFH